jgi:hypothetical protein
MRQLKGGFASGRLVPDASVAEIDLPEPIAHASKLRLNERRGDFRPGEAKYHTPSSPFLSLRECQVIVERFELVFSLFSEPDLQNRL